MTKPKIWISADWHYWHKNMTYGESVWPDKETVTRRFKTTAEMSRALIASINKYVQQDDEIYFLGDFAFSGIENIYNFWKQLNCKNIHFIPGNHDQHIKKNRILPNCHSDDSGNILDGSNPNAYKDWRDEMFNAEAQDLFHMLPELTTITYEKQLIVLSHYPIDQWEDMGRGSIMLHGHCHHQIDNCEINTKYRRMDVGIDWKEFRPYSLDEIMQMMNKRDIKKHVS